MRRRLILSCSTPSWPPGVWFPMGGLYRLVESLVSIAEAHGVRFAYRAPVRQIEVDGGRATGVVLEDGTRLSADVVVANADLPYVYDRLLPDRPQPNGWNARNTPARPSCSTGE